MKAAKSSMSVGFNVPFSVRGIVRSEGWWAEMTNYNPKEFNGQRRPCRLVDFGLPDLVSSCVPAYESFFSSHIPT